MERPAASSKLVAQKRLSVEVIARNSLEMRLPERFKPTTPRFTTTRAKTGLLVAQGHHGIDFAGAARGNIASGERDQRKQDRDSGEG